MLDKLIIIMSYFLLIVLHIPIILFLLEGILFLIYKFPLRKIKKLEKQVVIIEEAFRVKYPKEFEEHNYLFNDEEWYVTITKRFLKDSFVRGDIHSCCYGNTDYYIKEMLTSKKKCRTKVFEFFSGFIFDVENRRLKAVKRAINLEEFYVSVNGNTKKH